MRPDVLVVGAGPTGLTLALQAIDNGATVRIVERRPTAFRPSRALVMHARTLEVLRPFGVVDALLAQADTAPRARLRLGSRIVPVQLTGFGWTDTPFAQLTLVRQIDVEVVLAQALADRGIEVERGTELTGLSADAYPQGDARVRLRSAGSIEHATCRYVAGCDGAGSTVRTLLRVPWRGAPYRQEIVLADLELAGDLVPGAAHVVAGRRGLLFLFAIGEHATWRLLATRPTGVDPPPGPGDPAVSERELQRLIDDAGLPARITELAWSSRVRLQHRLAAEYRRGPAFLAGDAAHTHSPAAAQGMNTGIQDAANLGWKLAFAPASCDPAVVLDSYQLERRPVARRVLALTHLAFWGEASTDPAASFLRGVLAPLAAPLVPFVVRRRWPIARVARVLSQLDTRYPGSAVAMDAPPVPADGPRAGGRLPDTIATCDGRRVRLHELIARPGVAVLLDRDARSPAVASPRVRVHRLTDRPGTGVRVIRPDGYIGYRSALVDDRRLGAWLAHIGAMPSTA